MRDEGHNLNVVSLTRSLVDIPSITEEEEHALLFLESTLQDIAVMYGGTVERMPVEARRFNLYANWPNAGIAPVTFSTHVDTVPPFFPSSEDEEHVYGRGACDAKGILACMIIAIANLLERGVRGLGLLIVVGEERGSTGALVAGDPSASGMTDQGSGFLVNGEPTENKLALGTKGALRLELRAKGKMAHSAYPELGESAIDKLLDVLEQARMIALPNDPVLGQSTMNIGVIQGGRAPNVIADEAEAQILIRLVDDGESTRVALRSIAEGKLDISEILYIPAMQFSPLSGFESTAVAYTTDIPLLSPAWGEPYLLGPGNIHVAHTLEERVLKSELFEAVRLYEKLASELLAKHSAKER